MQTRRSNMQSTLNNFKQGQLVTWCDDDFSEENVEKIYVCVIALISICRIKNDFENIRESIRRFCLSPQPFSISTYAASVLYRIGGKHVQQCVTKHVWKSLIDRCIYFTTAMPILIEIRYLHRFKYMYHRRMSTETCEFYNSMVSTQKCLCVKFLSVASVRDFPVDPAWFT